VRGAAPGPVRPAAAILEDSGAARGRSAQVPAPTRIRPARGPAPPAGDRPPEPPRDRPPAPLPVTSARTASSKPPYRAAKTLLTPASSVRRLRIMRHPPARWRDTTPGFAAKEDHGSGCRRLPIIYSRGGTTFLASPELPSAIASSPRAAFNTSHLIRRCSDRSARCISRRVARPISWAKRSNCHASQRRNFCSSGLPVIGAVGGVLDRRFYHMPARGLSCRRGERRGSEAACAAPTFACQRARGTIAAKPGVIVEWPERSP
jgi:hypothetical protein